MSLLPYVIDASKRDSGISGIRILWEGDWGMECATDEALECL